MTIIKDLVVSPDTSRRRLKAPPVCLLMCTWSECIVKYPLIRPSTLFPLSHSVLFHSTPNYFNPLIARRTPVTKVHRERNCWGDECVWKCGHISHHRGLITGPSAPGLYSSGLLWPPLGWLRLKKMSRDFPCSCQPFHPPTRLLTPSPQWIRRREDLFTLLISLSKCDRTKNTTFCCLYSIQGWKGYFKCIP